MDRLTFKSRIQRATVTEANRDFHPTVVRVDSRNRALEPAGV